VSTVVGDPILIDAPLAGVKRLRLNRSEQRNVMTAELRDALDTALAEALSDPAVRAIVLVGGERAFSAGGDIASMEGLDVERARARLNAGHRLVRRLASAEKPIVGAPNGWTVGAAVGLLLLCDRIVGNRSTRFAFPFFRLALAPDWGISATLAHRVGAGRARQLLFGGRTVDAGEALEIGLLDELVEDDELEGAAVQRAAELGAIPSQAMALTKRMLRRASPLEEALELEGAAQPLCLLSADAAEGRAAFREKREPRFNRGDTDAP
jgi:2-(1,2-epoxy-1,2-dihydrophenyl)acetyl-CoA isomerase